MSRMAQNWIRNKGLKWHKATHRKDGHLTVCGTPLYFQQGRPVQTAEEKPVQDVCRDCAKQEQKEEGFKP